MYIYAWKSVCMSICINISTLMLNQLRKNILWKNVHREKTGSTTMQLVQSISATCENFTHTHTHNNNSTRLCKRASRICQNLCLDFVANACGMPQAYARTASVCKLTQISRCLGAGVCTSVLRMRSINENRKAKRENARKPEKKTA